MIEGIAVFVLTLWVMQLPFVWSDRTYLEHLRCTWLPARIRARERLEAGLERVGYRVIGPHPLQGRLVWQLVRNTTLQKWVPVALVFVLHSTSGLSPTWSGVLLAVYFTFLMATVDLTLEATGHRPFESNVASRHWRLLIPALLAQVILYTIAFSTAFDAVGRWADDRSFATIARMALSIALLAVGHLPVRFAVRMARRRLPPMFAGDAPLGSVLYLRPFGDDRSRISWPNNVGFLGSSWVKLVSPRFEELLTTAVMSEGPLIAIGRPGEALPELGASRTYWPDAGWREAVDNSAHRASRVLAIAGLTDGVRWELESLRSWDLLRKTLIVFPPGTAAATRSRFHTLIDVLGIEAAAFDDFAPEFLVAVGFDRNDCPVFFTAAGRTWGAYFAAIHVHVLHMVKDSSA